MSLGYGCAGDDCENPVNWLLTHMSPPGTLSVCDDHAPVFMIGLLAGQLGVDNARLYDAIRKHVDREAKAAAKAATQAAMDEADAIEAAEAQAEHADGIPPMSRQAAEATESGGLVMDPGPPS